jgi:hypothetical protein
MTTSTSRRVGLGIFGLLSVIDAAGLLLTDGDNPPYAVAAVDTLLGVVSLVLVVQAFRDPGRPLRLLTGLRILSAVTAVPAFFIADVPTAAVIAAAAIVALTAVGVMLTASNRTAAVAS